MKIGFIALIWFVINLLVYVAISQATLILTGTRCWWCVGIWQSASTVFLLMFCGNKTQNK
jgi:hypothetical protein